MGDVKLAFSLGLYLGWLGWGQVFLGGFLAFLLGAVIGVGLIATGVKGRKDVVPFGPFLALGNLAHDPVGRPDSAAGTRARNCCSKFCPLCLSTYGC